VAGYEPAYEPAGTGNRMLWPVVGAVLVTLILGVGAVAATSLLGSDDDTGIAAGPDPGNDTTSTTETADTAEGDAESTATTETANESQPTIPDDLGDYGDLTGTTVTITGVESADAELAGIRAALEALSSETGIEITYTAAFEEDLSSMIAAGDTPDINIFAQPNLLADHAINGDLIPIPNDVASNVSLVWNGQWTGLGQVDGTQYGVPNRADLKSLVWYKPARFEELGYAVPGSWNELMSLTDQAIADGHTPWCVGIESGAATGWVFTDWVEDLVLRRHGPAVYDQWVAGEVRFSDPAVTDTFEVVRDLWTTPGAVYAANGSIATTGFGDSGPPLVADDCLMHRQASFFSAFMPAGTAFANGSADAIDVFYLPSEDQNRPVLGGGGWAAAFTDRPEVWAVMQYLGSTEYANNRQAAQVDSGSPTGFLTAVDGVDRNLFSPLENSMLDILAVADPVRYDASDAMPGSVGAGTFWSAGAAFVNGDIDVAEATTAIDASWPR
jgi:alpha-glucoside transport system substrate-binding protein